MEPPKYKADGSPVQTGPITECFLRDLLNHERDECTDKVTRLDTANGKTLQIINEAHEKEVRLYADQIQGYKDDQTKKDKRIKLLSRITIIATPIAIASIIALSFTQNESFQRAETVIFFVALAAAFASAAYEISKPAAALLGGISAGLAFFTATKVITPKQIFSFVVVVAEKNGYKMPTDKSDSSKGTQPLIDTTKTKKLTPSSKKIENESITTPKRKKDNKTKK